MKPKKGSKNGLILQETNNNKIQKQGFHLTATICCLFFGCCHFKTENARGDIKIKDKRITYIVILQKKKSTLGEKNSLIKVMDIYKKTPVILSRKNRVS